MYMRVALGAVHLQPFGTPIVRTAIGPGYSPRLGQRVIDGRDVVVEDVGIRLVEVNAFLDDGLIVAVQGQARGVVGARSLEMAGFDPQRGLAGVALLLKPLSERIYAEQRVVLRWALTA